MYKFHHDSDGSPYMSYDCAISKYKIRIYFKLQIYNQGQLFYNKYSCPKLF